MDVKKTNKSFSKNQAILRDKYYGEAINGLLASGKYEDTDMLIEKAFEIAVKAVANQRKFEGSALNIFPNLFSKNMLFKG